ncbi:PREDICTED: uncharacterized protein LOC104294791, partial [Charadrius vociferus]|uniref:uncharacterized protein LOC104294791 n=1 Tax=Charadrius vociferus TaxID=50402 RepID=UPI0005215973
MYGNIESSQAEQGQMWPPAPPNVTFGVSQRRANPLSLSSLPKEGPQACDELCPAEENLYEPLDPVITVPSQKHVPDSPASWCCSREKLVLLGTVALGVSVLVNALLLAVGSRHIAALTAALEAEKAKELPNMVSQSFLLYNEAHSMCVEAKGQELTVTTCQPQAAAQRFQWLQGGRLWGWGSQRCVTATRGQNLALVRLEPCRDDDTLQRWECRDGGLLALAGYNLYFNYGNNKQRTVMLYTGDREWSRWVIHGSKDDVCSRSGWTYFGNSCYFYSKTPSSWENAQRFCSVLGMQLLEVDGPEERGHIQTMLQSSSWLGIRDVEVEGTWKRANGTILPRESSSWHRDEPNGGRQENCAAVREDGE